MKIARMIKKNVEMKIVDTSDGSKIMLKQEGKCPSKPSATMNQMNIHECFYSTYASIDLNFSKFSESPRIPKLSSTTLVALFQPIIRYYMVIFTKLSSDTLVVPQVLRNNAGSAL